MAYHGLVHGHNVLQHCHGLALDGGNEGTAGQDSLFFLFLTQKLQNPSSGLLFESQILVKVSMNGVDRHPLVSSKCFYALAMIFRNGGSNRGDEASSPDCFLWIEKALVIRVFSSLTSSRCPKLSSSLGPCPLHRLCPQFFLLNSLF